MPFQDSFASAECSPGPWPLHATRKGTPLPGSLYTRRSAGSERGVPPWCVASPGACVVSGTTRVNPAARKPHALGGGHMLEGFKMRTSLNARRIFLFGFYNASVSNEIVAFGACRCPPRYMPPPLDVNPEETTPQPVVIARLHFQHRCRSHVHGPATVSGSRTGCCSRRSTPAVRVATAVPSRPARWRGFQGDPR